LVFLFLTEEQVWLGKSDNCHLYLLLNHLFKYHYYIRGKNSFWQIFFMPKTHYANNAIFFLFCSVFAKKNKSFAEKIHGLYSVRSERQTIEDHLTNLELNSPFFFRPIDGSVRQTDINPKAVKRADRQTFKHRIHFFVHGGE
jgi:hypothetical protein